MPGWKTAGSSLAWVLVFGLGCEITGIDEDLSGVFPCESTDDCPGGQQCVAATCHVGDPPNLLLLSPEDEQPLPYAGAPVTATIRLTGSGLDLLDPALEPDPEYGRGYVVVLLDGVEVARFTAGSLSGAVSSADVEVQGAPGAHRLEARAHFADGRLYDNPGARVRRLFWVDDGLPHVGFKKPFPGDAYELEPSLIDVELATVNFTFVKANPSGVVANGGHVHVHYTGGFPDCVDDPACDNRYVGIIAPQAPAFNVVGQAALPASAAGTAPMTAVLREANHFAFRSENGAPVWETVEIRRDPLAEDHAEAEDVE